MLMLIELPNCVRSHLILDGFQHMLPNFKNRSCIVELCVSFLSLEEYVFWIFAHGNCGNSTLSFKM